ncbi:MAG TPA: beta-methylgalactoside transporter, partial [Firmicutes bacterium]|nr:beta-methylgalactoside transporter [Bacillota bacterium]
MSRIDLSKVKNFVSTNAIYIVLVVLVSVIAFVDPRFLSIVCLRDILIQSATRIIIALGVFFIILTGGTDLSAGRMVGFAAVLSASMLQAPDYLRRFYPDLPQLPLWIPILLAIVVGLLVGLGNGFSVARLNVPPFIATL